MSSPDRLERFGMSPIRMFLFVITMPAAIVALLIGLGWIGMSAALSGTMTLATVPATAYALFALGLVATATIAVLRRGSTAFARVVRTRGAEIEVIRFLRQQLGPIENGHVVVADRTGRPLAQLVLDDTTQLAELRAAIAPHAPNARFEETIERID